MLPVLHRPSESSAVGLRWGIGIRVRQHLRNVNRTEVCPRYHTGLAIRNLLWLVCLLWQELVDRFPSETT